MMTPMDALKIMGLVTLVILVLILTARVGAYRATKDTRLNKSMWTSIPTIVWMILTPILACAIILGYIILVWPIN